MSIKLENVSYTYMKKTPYERTALKEVTLTIEKGEYIAVIGHTGSGKSTMMQHLNGLLSPYQVKVFVFVVYIISKGAEAKKARNKVGMVFQFSLHQIFAETIFEDVAFGPRNKGLSEAEVEQQVKAALSFVGLDYDTFANRSPFQLSGGQMRRVAIPGVVALDPENIKNKKQKAGLDPQYRDNIFREINSLYQARKMAVILVTHSMEEAAQYAKRLLVMAKGKVVIDGSSAEVFQHHREDLKNLGVDVPQAIKLADVLREHGLQIGNDVLKTEDLIQQIKLAKGWM